MESKCYLVTVDITNARITVEVPVDAENKTDARNEAEAMIADGDWESFNAVTFHDGDMKSKAEIDE